MERVTRSEIEEQLSKLDNFAVARVLEVCAGCKELIDLMGLASLTEGPSQRRNPHVLDGWRYVQTTSATLRKDGQRQVTVKQSLEEYIFETPANELGRRVLDSLLDLSCMPLGKQTDAQTTEPDWVDESAIWLRVAQGLDAASLSEVQRELDHLKKRGVVISDQSNSRWKPYVLLREFWPGAFRRPEPIAVRMTRGTDIWPPVI